MPLSTAALLCLLALAGCRPAQPGQTRGLYAPGRPLQSIAASLSSGHDLAPGERGQLVVNLTEPNGNVLSTLGDKALWNALHIAATGIDVQPNGAVEFPKDPRLSDDKPAHLVITLPGNPGLSASLEIRPRYDAAFRAEFHGVVGSKGLDGTRGLDGISGYSGSTNPKSPTPGGNGGNGGAGGDGHPGHDGENGPTVAVRLAIHPGTYLLLECGVKVEGKPETFFLIDPNGGSLTVSSRGGSGGSGGRGGRGGRGGSGGSGSPSGIAGISGTSGLDGRRGSDGHGGVIELTYDPAAQPYLSVLHLESPNGPQPELTEAPVLPLW